MDDPVINILTKLKGIKWIAYIIVVVLIIIGIANLTDAVRKIYDFSSDLIAYFQKRKLTNEQLKADALKTAQELMDMVSERQANEPQVDFDNWTKSTQEQIKHSQETQNLYYKNFAGRVAQLRDEFIKRGKRDKELDSFYDHPTNYIGLRIVASKLAMLAHSL